MQPKDYNPDYSYTIVEYHSQYWEYLVSTGWQTHTVDNGLATLIKARNCPRRWL
jgi:hypothetical protein